MTAMKFHHMDRTKATLHELGNTHSVEQIVGSHDKKSKYRPCVTINMVTCDESPFVAPLRGAREASYNLTCDAPVCGLSLQRSKKENKRSSSWSSVCIELEANKKKKSLMG